jgi:hypothetical protein
MSVEKLDILMLFRAKNLKITKHDVIFALFPTPFMVVYRWEYRECQPALGKKKNPV